MMNSTKSEQWLSGGDCKLCRRSKYCSKVCKANKEATQRDIYSAVNKATGGIFAHMLEKQASLFRQVKVMSGNLVVDWVNNVLSVAEKGYDCGGNIARDEAFMEILGMCDAVLKSLGYNGRYGLIKYRRFFEVMSGEDVTVLSWALEVLDCTIKGLRTGYAYKKDKYFKCIIGICKTILTTLEYVYPEDMNKYEKDF